MGPRSDASRLPTDLGSLVAPIAALAAVGPPSGAWTPMPGESPLRMVGRVFGSRGGLPAFPPASEVLGLAQS
jgi:hypothetical protein